MVCFETIIRQTYRLIRYLSP